MLEMLMVLFLCGLAYIAYRVARQFSGYSGTRSGTARASLSWLAMALSSGAAVVRQQFARKREQDEAAAETSAPARMRILDARKLSAEGVWPCGDKRDDYYERIEQNLEQWFGLYERGRISEETYEGLLEGELRRAMSDRQVLIQSSNFGVSNGLFTFEEVDEAIAAIRWCIAWISEQGQVKVDRAGQKEAERHDDPVTVMALPSAA